MGKEFALKILHGRDITSYDFHIWYANKMVETNPINIVKIEREGERFKKWFFCFCVYLDNFRRGCRPLLLFNRTHLLGRYGGIMFSVIG